MRNVSLVYKALALVAAASLAACGGGRSNSTPSVPAPPSSSTVLNNIVGVGDSLTAGYQSNGFFGGPPGSVANPLATGLPVAALGVPPGQESGWWAQFYMQAKGVTYTQMADPTASVLPLIGAPGLDNQIVPANPALTGGVPFGQLPSRTDCDSFDQAAYSKTTALSTVRENPNATVHDLGVPGLTLHEAVTLYQPPSPTCVALTGAPASIVGLQQLLSEGGAFYPVLGGFAGAGQPGFSQLSAATSLHPTLATVWLGANDLLHYTFAGGAFAGEDSTLAQVQADMTTIITSLQRSGADVVVANLPDILKTPHFSSVNPAPTAQQCQLQTYLVCELQLIGFSAAAASATTNAVAQQYGLGTTGYLTLSGVLTLAGELQKGAPINLDPQGPGTGLGRNYLTPTFATSVQNLNDTLNSGIAAATTATKVPMVDIHTIFNDIASANVSDPLAALALGGINPPVCCSLTFGGGLVSFDGLHPSNTGYALIALAFINATNTAYGTSIPPIDPKAVHNGTVGVTNQIPFHDPYAQ